MLVVLSASVIRLEGVAGEKEGRNDCEERRKKKDWNKMKEKKKKIRKRWNTGNEEMNQRKEEKNRGMR